MGRTTPRAARARRGYTLLEMLVVVALVVMMMMVLVGIFEATTGALTVARANQELDQRLRMLDGTMRHDLAGATARFTPPLDPKDNLGYFEYGENALSDAQGEDTDDYLRFTAKAPAGQPFTGRLMIASLPASGFPTPRWYLVTSDYAEIVYFLRDGNLYRRVLLIAPERKGSLTLGTQRYGAYLGAPTSTTLASWQGMNDISARPTLFGFGRASPVPTPNTLGDLTNRENRFVSPRLCDDYTGPFSVPDGVSDDTNLDGAVDFYPTLFPNAFGAYSGDFNQGAQVNFSPPTNIPAYADPIGKQSLITRDAMAFPYLFPGMYSAAAPTAPMLGRMHSLDPTGTIFNHAPLELGDSLPVPTSASQYQTWWGFPTWNEMMYARGKNPLLPGQSGLPWSDPVWRLNAPIGLVAPAGVQPPGLSILGNFKALPPSSAPFTLATAGSNEFVFPAPDILWKDDLLATGVRSFDVKTYDDQVLAYDGLAPGLTANGVQTHLIPTGCGYVDLGYLNSDDPSVLAQYKMPVFENATQAGVALGGFGHEGRVPPLKVVQGQGDYRFNPQLPTWDVGDLGPDTVRLRRVYDTWSTVYTNAPLVGWGQLSISQVFGGAPLYPSYPAPYPIPLRGIQIQIRLVDPSNEHVKVLTIRQDFSDKR